MTRIQPSEKLQPKSIIPPEIQWAGAYPYFCIWLYLPTSRVVRAGFRNSLIAARAYAESCAGTLRATRRKRGSTRPCPFLGDGQWAPSADLTVKAIQAARLELAIQARGEVKMRKPRKAANIPKSGTSVGLLTRWSMSRSRRSPRCAPTSCKLALARTIKLHRAKLRNQQSGRNRRFGRLRPVLGWTIMMIDDDAGATFAHATGPSWWKSESGKGGSAGRATIFAPQALRVFIMILLVVLPEQNHESADRSRN
ncbi:hypothetical protein AMK06_CH02303 [Rhizobium sp. N541]|nr:hypothetical protein AMK06_CH02303 [Rhizobium sp. N541]ANM23582.1 hypothetical protein AMK07_CH02300 [Rhizobium sp. N941]